MLYMGQTPPSNKNGQNQSTQPSNSIPTRLLKLGSRGEDVRQLQKRLNELGFSCGAADGIFGNATRAAVIAFQRANGLTADGIAGPATLGKLFADVPPADQNHLRKIHRQKIRQAPVLQELSYR